jgi:hypothetical protein
MLQTPAITKRTRTINETGLAFYALNVSVIKEGLNGKKSCKLVCKKKRAKRERSIEDEEC